MNKIDIEIRFTPRDISLAAIELGDNYKALASQINKLDMDSREKTIAIEKLEESFMWACKGSLLEE